MTTFNCLAVVGSRGYQDMDEFKSVVDKYTVNSFVSGGCPSGADRLVEIYAKQKKIPITVIPAKWSEFGRAAGPIRNKEIVEIADGMIAFWDNESRGTKSSIDLAKKKGIPVIIINVN